MIIRVEEELLIGHIEQLPLPRARAPRKDYNIPHFTGALHVPGVAESASDPLHRFVNVRVSHFLSNIINSDGLVVAKFNAWPERHSRLQFYGRLQRFNINLRQSPWIETLLGDRVVNRFGNKGPQRFLKQVLATEMVD